MKLIERTAKLLWGVLVVGGLATLPASAAVPKMKIVAVSCKGEYVDLRNTATTAKDLTGWRLHDFGKVHTYVFPKGFVLGAGKAVRIWSAGQAGGPYPTFVTWTAASVWNNSGDRASLRRPDGSLVAQRVCDDAGGP